MAEPAVGLPDFGAGDILPRAALLNCVADVSSPEVAALVERLGPWMPYLRPVLARAAVLAALPQVRPDVVILSRSVDASDLDAVARHITTASIGVVALMPAAEAVARVSSSPRGLPPLVGIEIVDPAAGLAETVLRMRALLRRCRPLALSQRRHVGELMLDEAALTLTLGDRVAPLTLDGFRLLGPMFDLPDHVWSRGELLSVAYGAMRNNNPRIVDVKLNRTRRRLQSALGRDPVRTVRGKGYRLAPLP